MDTLSTLVINPSILKWARNDTNLTLKEVAQRLNIDENQYLSWEIDGLNVPFACLIQLSNIFKLQIATFFLPNTPEKHRKPNDYRNVSLQNNKLSLDTSLAIRRTNRFRDLLSELNGKEYYDIKYSWLSEIAGLIHNSSISDDKIADWLRLKLEYSVNNQVNEKKFEDAYLHWRNALENKLGIHVFQFSLPKNEVQGFCFSISPPYSISINSKYPVSSRIFTLLHELGHIIKKQSGLCIPDKVTERRSLEFECNSFASKLLLPSDVVFPSINKDEIYKLAQHFKVSSEVYLRRLKSLDLISNEDFRNVLEDIHNSVKPLKHPGIATPRQKSINTRGQALYNTVLQAINKDVISYERGADVLGLKINYLLNS